MDLVFSTKFGAKVPTIGGKPTYFIERIIEGLNTHKLVNFQEWERFVNDGVNKGLINLDYLDNCQPKIHTIRRDINNRWAPGKKIHFIIGARTKNRYQFAPILICKSVQKINIEYQKTGLGFMRFVKVDGRQLSAQDIELLALNDGFENVEQFYSYFNTDFTGKLIHWALVKY